jgi:Ca2+-binding EF-hand superfamily protein
MKTMVRIQANSRLNHSLIMLVISTILITPSVRADDKEQQAIREVNFTTADVDGDGALTQAEFQAFIDANADDNLGRAATLRRFGAYERAFNKLDKDNSGTVSWSEVMDGLAEAN